MKNFKKNAWLGLLTLALAACVAGCESDPVAPQDELPAVTAEGSAATSAAIAKIMVEVGPIILDPSKAVVDVDLDDPLDDYEDLSGTFHIDYRDGPDGAPAEPGDALWAHGYTDDGSPVVVDFGDYGGQSEFEFDVTADITRGTPDSVEILDGSGGTMVSGERNTTFTASGLVIDGGDYPASGTVTVDPADGPESTVTFNGTDKALAFVDGTYYEVDLDDGSVTEMMPI